MAPPALRPSWSSSRTRPTRLIIPLTAALRALYLTLRYGALPGPADVPVLDFNAPQHALFTGFARFSSVPPRARIGMMSRITTRGPPYGDRHIPARPNAYVLTSRSWLRVPNGEPQEWYEK